MNLNFRFNSVSFRNETQSDTLEFKYNQQFYTRYKINLNKHNFALDKCSSLNPFWKTKRTMNLHNSIILYAITRCPPYRGSKFFKIWLYFTKQCFPCETCRQRLIKKSLHCYRMFFDLNFGGGGGVNFTPPSPCCFLPNNSKWVNTVTFQLCSIK